MALVTELKEIKGKVLPEPIYFFLDKFTYMYRIIHDHSILFRDCILLKYMGKLKTGDYVMTIRMDLKFIGYNHFDQVFVDPSYVR